MSNIYLPKEATDSFGDLAWMAVESEFKRNAEFVALISSFMVHALYLAALAFDVVQDKKTGSILRGKKDTTTQKHAGDLSTRWGLTGKGKRAPPGDARSVHIDEPNCSHIFGDTRGRGSHGGFDIVLVFYS